MKRFIIAAFGILLTAFCGIASQPERGYRGFVDFTNRLYRTQYLNLAGNFCNKTEYSPGISTSHGFQFNNWLFAGAGLDYTLKDIGFPDSHHYDIDSYVLSIFADVRTDLQFGKFTPFADVRLGWNASSYGTVYFSPTIGYRFNWGRKVGINIGVGYTLDSYRYEKHVWGITTDGLNMLFPTGEFYNFNQSSFTFRLGIDF